MRGVLRTPGRESNTCKGPGVEMTPQQRGRGRPQKRRLCREPGARIHKACGPY